MTDFPWLSAALLLPILGAVVVSLLPARDGDLPKKVAFGFSLLTLVLVAVIAQPNPASDALHRSFGFEEVGVHRAIGWKHGRWHDVPLVDGPVTYNNA